MTAHRFFSIKKCSS